MRILRLGVTAHVASVADALAAVDGTEFAGAGEGGVAADDGLRTSGTTGKGREHFEGNQILTDPRKGEG